MKRRKVKKRVFYVFLILMLMILVLSLFVGGVIAEDDAKPIQNKGIFGSIFDKVIDFFSGNEPTVSIGKTYQTCELCYATGNPNSESCLTCFNDAETVSSEQGYDDIDTSNEGASGDTGATGASGPTGGSSGNSLSSSASTARKKCIETFMKIPRFDPNQFSSIWDYNDLRDICGYWYINKQKLGGPLTDLVFCGFDCPKGEVCIWYYLIDGPYDYIGKSYGVVADAANKGGGFCNKAVTSTTPPNQPTETPGTSPGTGTTGSTRDYKKGDITELDNQIDEYKKQCVFIYYFYNPDKNKCPLCSKYDKTIQDLGKKLAGIDERILWIGKFDITDPFGYIPKFNKVFNLKSFTFPSIVIIYREGDKLKSRTIIIEKENADLSPLENDVKEYLKKCEKKDNAGDGGNGGPGTGETGANPSIPDYCNSKSTYDLPENALTGYRYRTCYNYYCTDYTETEKTEYTEKEVCYVYPDSEKSSSDSETDNTETDSVLENEGNMNILGIFSNLKSKISGNSILDKIAGFFSGNEKQPGAVINNIDSCQSCYEKNSAGSCQDCARQLETPLDESEGDYIVDTYDCEVCPSQSTSPAFMTAQDLQITGNAVATENSQIESSPNFIVSALGYGKYILKKAECYRKTISEEFFGKELPAGAGFTDIDFGIDEKLEYALAFTQIRDVPKRPMHALSIRTPTSDIDNAINLKLKQEIALVVLNTWIPDIPAWLKEGIVTIFDDKGRKQDRTNIFNIWISSRSYYPLEKLFNMKKSSSLSQKEYAASHAVVAYLLCIGGKERFFRFAKEIGSIGYQRAIQKYYGMSINELQKEFQDFIKDNVNEIEKEPDCANLKCNKNKRLPKLPPDTSDKDEDYNKPGDTPGLTGISGLDKIISKDENKGYCLYLIYFYDKWPGYYFDESLMGYFMNDLLKRLEDQYNRNGEKNLKVLQFEAVNKNYKLFEIFKKKYYDGLLLPSILVFDSKGILRSIIKNGREKFNYQRLDNLVEECKKPSETPPTTPPAPEPPQEKPQPKPPAQPPQQSQVQDPECVNNEKGKCNKEKGCCVNGKCINNKEEGDLLAATVLVKADGKECSGTIIDFRDIEALILTCGEFSESDDIKVDFFNSKGDKVLKDVPGKLKKSDKEKGLGLVSVCVKNVKILKVAPPGYKVEKGDGVVSLNVVKDIVKPSYTFVGSIKNSLIETAGVDAVNRGGGLISNCGGFVIGVYNGGSAEGSFFVALDKIQKFLNELGLEGVYNEKEEGKRFPKKDVEIPPTETPSTPPDTKPPKTTPPPTETKPPAQTGPCLPTPEKDGTICTTENNEKGCCSKGVCVKAKEESELIAASVVVKGYYNIIVKDNRGNIVKEFNHDSHNEVSGTIIHSIQGQALILTVSHFLGNEIFLKRRYEKEYPNNILEFQPRAFIDLFDSNGNKIKQNIPARIQHWNSNLDQDVAFLNILIPSGININPVSLSKNYDPKAGKPKKGDPASIIGIGKGETMPVVKKSKITAIDKFNKIIHRDSDGNLFPATLDDDFETDGKSAEGNSGGGVYDKCNELIGMAMTVSEKETINLGVNTIKNELKKAGLDYILKISLIIMKNMNIMSESIIK